MNRPEPILDFVLSVLLLVFAVVLASCAVAGLMLALSLFLSTVFTSWL